MFSTKSDLKMKRYITFYLKLVILAHQYLSNSLAI